MALLHACCRLGMVWAILLIACPLMAEEPPAEEQQWGDLEMQFVFDGETPQPRMFNPPGGGPPVADESLLVDPQTKGIANIFVWLRDSKNNPVPIHPDYDETAHVPVTWIYQGGRPQPRAITLRTTQTLVVSNQEPGPINFNLEVFRNQRANPDIIIAGGSGSYRFALEEGLPIKVSNYLAPWVEGWVLVKNCPYMGVTGVDGKLVLRNLPVGGHEFEFWHESCSSVRQVVVDGQLHQWAKGRKRVAIQPGKNALGVIKVNEKLLNGLLRFR